MPPPHWDPLVSYHATLSKNVYKSFENLVLFYYEILKNKTQGTCFKMTVRKQPTFRAATTGFPAKWRLRNERRNSILMTRHYPDLGWVICLIVPRGKFASTIWKVIMKRHQWNSCRCSLYEPRDVRCFLRPILRLVGTPYIFANIRCKMREVSVI